MFCSQVLKRSEMVGDFFVPANVVATFLWCSHVETVGNGRGFFFLQMMLPDFFGVHMLKRSETVGDFFLHMMLPDFFGVHMLKRSETVQKVKLFLQMARSSTNTGPYATKPK